MLFAATWRSEDRRGREETIGTGGSQRPRRLPRRRLGRKERTRRRLLFDTKPTVDLIPPIVERARGSWPRSTAGSTRSAATALRAASPVWRGGLEVPLGFFSVLGRLGVGAGRVARRSRPTSASSTRPGWGRPPQPGPRPAPTRPRRGSS